MAQDAHLSSRERRTVARLRLAAQLIATQADGIRTPADVVARLTAMQAQDFAAAKWAIALRLPGTTEQDVECALADGSIVRSWPMRGTLHFVAPDDLGWILGLTTERLLQKARTRHTELGLTPAHFERAREVAQQALGGGKSLTRDEMYELFASIGISSEGQRGYHVIWYLAQTGTLCLGAPRAKQQTFVLLDDWVSAPRLLAGDEALGELAARYFRGHGPASVRDFAWWASLTLAQARTGVAVAREQLASLTLGGVEYLAAPELLDSQPPAAAAGVFALPAFDEFLLGYQDRGAALDARHAPRIVPGSNGVFQPTIVHGAAIVGTWRRKVTAKHVAVEPLPFSPLSATATAGFARAAKNYARYLGVPLELASR